jgi:pimeloyl-ACP methyl ester carboxylesterase
MKKTIKRIFSVLIVLLVVLVLVFYRADRTIESLEVDYFTDNSHYMDVTISTLDEQPLSLKVHFQDYGNFSDPVVVLLHGAFASSHTFEPWALDLVEQGYRVIAIDLPYHGLTRGFDDQVTSIRRSAAVVRAVLSQLAITELTIGGNSMGGGVSWYFASEYHNVDGIFVNGLILIDAIYPSTSSREQSQFLSHPVVASIVSKMTPKFVLRYVLNGVYGTDSTIKEATLTRYYDLLLKSKFRYGILTNTQEDLSDDVSGVARLERIKDAQIPVLVMWGIEDSWIPVEVADLFKSTLNLDDDSIVIYTGIGHVPMEENPELTFIDLIDFLNRN